MFKPFFPRRDYHLWIRHEIKKGERRTALIPEHVQKVVDAGHQVTVERSPTRIFPDSDYEKIKGVKMAPTNSWNEFAPSDCYILGLKELPTGFPLRHTHIYFAHVYKGQSGDKETLQRFKIGGGKILDLEFLVNDRDRRVCAFGYSAGYVGAAVSVKQWGLRQQNDANSLGPLSPWLSDQELISDLKKTLEPSSKQGPPKVVVIGPNGRVGSGSVGLLKKLGLEPAKWDRTHTGRGGPFPELLTDYDIFLNCIYLDQSIPPFIDMPTLKKHNKSRRLTVIGDISCDPSSPENPLPIYSNTNTLDNPITTIYSEENGTKKIPRLDMMAIDYLPTLLPRESSIDFSEQFYPVLRTLGKPQQTGPIWQRAYDLFDLKSQSVLEKDDFLKFCFKQKLKFDVYEQRMFA